MTDLEMPTRHRSSPRRVWGPGDAAAAFLLVFGAGWGSMSFVADAAHVAPERLGGVAWPWSTVPLVLLVAGVVLMSWYVMGPHGQAMPIWLAGALLCATLSAIVGFYAYYVDPWAKTSDSSDALQRGVEQLRSGHNPYGTVTFLGNQLSPMLGGFVLAAPFIVVLGSLFLQGIAWLFATVAGLVRIAGARAALAFSVLLFASPIIRLSLPNQYDHTVVVMALVISGSLGYFACRATPRTRSHWALFGSALLFGVASADRFVYLVTFAPLAVLIWRHGQRRPALRWIATSGCVAGALILLPLVINHNAYLDGPIAAGLGHAGNGGVAHTKVVLVVVGLALLGVVVARVQTLAGVWLGSSLVLASVIFLNAASSALTTSWGGAFTTYDATALNAGWLVLGLCGLVLPRSFVLDGRVLPAAVDQQGHQTG